MTQEDERSAVFMGGMLIDVEAAPVPAPTDSEGWRSAHGIIVRQWERALAEALERDGCVPPRFMMLSVDGDRLLTHVLFPSPDVMNDREGKDVVVFVVKRYARKVKAVTIYTCIEAWMLINDQLDGTKRVARDFARDAYDKYESLEHHPDRTEVIWLTQETRIPGVDTFQTYAPIIRVDSRPTVKEWVRPPSGYDSAGRFAGLLADIEEVAKAKA